MISIRVTYVLQAVAVLLGAGAAILMAIAFHNGEWFLFVVNAVFYGMNAASFSLYQKIRVRISNETR